MMLYDSAEVVRTGDGIFEAHTDPVYWNAVGPFGGWIAAVLVHCIALETGGKGDPLTLSVNFAGGMEPGTFVVRLRLLRGNRSTSFWSAEIVQEQSEGEVLCAFATVVFATRRETPVFPENVAPKLPGPDDLPRFEPPVRAVFLKRLDMRFISDNQFPKLVDGATYSWIRSLDSSEMDFETLTAICDAGIPQIFLRLRRPVPVSSVTMNVFYHATRDEVSATGNAFLLTGSRMRNAGNGFFDTTTSVWTQAGLLLATTEQVVWFKAPE